MTKTVFMVCFYDHIDSIWSTKKLAEKRAKEISGSYEDYGLVEMPIDSVPED